MDPSEIHNFEDQWKKGFDEASETPPPSVWAGIEARLDREEDDIIPLWWRSPKLWYAAASIAALLLVGGGLWLSNRSGISDKTGVEMAAKTASSTAEEKVNRKESADPAVKKQESTELIASDHSTKGSVSGTEKSTAFTKQPDHKPLGNSVGTSETLIATGKQLATRNNADRSLAVSGNERISRQSGLSPEIKTIASEENISPAKTDFNPNKAVAVSRENKIQVDLLEPNQYSDLDVYMQKRYVFFKADQKAEEPLPAPKKHTEYYAAVGLMPASFNPDVKIKAAPLAFSQMASSRQKAVTGTSEAGNSYAIQTQGGMRLSKHWSMEMGLNYLKGNSRYEGGGYLLDATSSASSNVLESALSGISTNQDYTTGKNQQIVGSNAFYIDVNKKVNNDYQYLQLPVQAGFTLNPDKKLSYSVLGGMMANFFLNNQLESASGETITTTADDGVYRGMNWAATTGLRLNYRLSSKWKANLTGSYQKAVSSGFKANQSLESHPYLYGVSWGFRYSF
ncbi:outer membrane beta-barrel protein [Dyadobacter psychrotolerans]|uniref:Outer membrane protein beta-barrel domain-containing protein n=1 Tax=Dyadobacter psychrotolerans TaxID=2541721 RepID=A0A4R5DRV3_9BACT|nr:outer membrane beta-barrel protein [Dyadobacter psychrotolerans]TDE13825.1 hypothetical protein E0F88_18215 [Dyadobacter psychrotolerans]